jgi:protein tyrosine/serine phosphatase
MAERLPPPVREWLSPSVNYLDMLLVDHGIFRLLYLNKHKLAPGAWRAAQPAPHDIDRLARQGLRTIINLRGPRDCGAYRLERKACGSRNIMLIDFTLGSRAAPKPEMVLTAAELFGQIDYPVLMHCKSGADRAGLMSALYLHVKEGVPIELAKEQLSWRYGHFRNAATGILDAFFEQYLADNRRRPVPFLEWVATTYDPVALKREFRPSGWSSAIVDRVLRRE